MGERTGSLKVTLGAFSCTVEGFDDPLDVVRRAAALMSEIAEADPVFAAAVLGGAGTPEDLSSLPGRAEEVLAAEGSELAAEIIGRDRDPVPGPPTGAAPPPPESDALAMAIARIAGRSVDAAPLDDPDAARMPEPGIVDPEPPAGEGDDVSGSDIGLAAGPDGFTEDSSEADQDSEDVRPDDPAEDAGETASAGPGEQGRPEDAVDRLIVAARDRMEEPETSRRLASLRRLRHAVLATAADRMGPALAPGDDHGPYGADLDRAIGREPPKARTPDGGHTAPLVLVSSQRIDRGGDALRIRSGDDRRTELELVEASGPGAAQASLTAAEIREIWTAREATTFEDRMAAAAEALSGHGGSPALGFTRPDLMSAVAAADPDGAADRDERLRTFASLLQTGRVRRIGRGIYAAGAERGEELTAT